jgi:viroplasmin and RNaseH domain-containing protein
VCNTWECKARVDGVRGAEFRAFPTAEAAMDWVKAAKLGRKVNYMNIEHYLSENVIRWGPRFASSCPCVARRRKPHPRVCLLP